MTTNLMEVITHARDTNTLGALSPHQLDIYERSVKHGLIEPLQSQKGPVVPIPDHFDPTGSGYDYATALSHGILPDDTGHWQSLVPETGQVLKGANHPTFDKTVEEERKMGSRIVYDETGTLYSRDLSSLRSDGTEKGSGYLGPRKMTDGSGRVVTDMTVEGGLVINNRNVEYPMLVPTLTDAEIEIVMRGGDIPDSIRAKAIDHARMRIEGGQSQFFNHAPDLQQNFSPFYAYNELTNGESKEDGYLKVLMKGVGIGLTTDLPRMVGEAVQFASPDTWYLDDVGKSIVKWSDKAAENLWGGRPHYENSFKQMVFEATSMLAPSFVPYAGALSGARLVLNIGRLRKLQRVAWATKEAANASYKAEKAAGLGKDALNVLKAANSARAKEYVALTKRLKMLTRYSNAATMGVVGPLFGLSRGQQTKQTGEARADYLDEIGEHDKADAIRQKLLFASWSTAGTEATLESLSNLFFLRMMGLSGKAAALKIASASPAEINKQNMAYVMSVLRRVGIHAPMEVPVEMAQEASAAAIEKQTDIRPEARILGEALRVMGPAALLGAMLGMGTASIQIPRAVRKGGILDQQRKYKKDTEESIKKRKAFYDELKKNKEEYEGMSGEEQADELKKRGVKEDRIAAHQDLRMMSLQNIANIFKTDPKTLKEFTESGRRMQQDTYKKSSGTDKAAMGFIMKGEEEGVTNLLPKGKASLSNVQLLLQSDIAKKKGTDAIEGLRKGIEKKGYDYPQDSDDKSSPLSIGADLYRQARSLDPATEGRKGAKLYKRAIKKFGEEVKKNPDSVAAYYNTGLAYEKFQEGYELIGPIKIFRGNRNKATKAFKKVIELVEKEKKEKGAENIGKDLEHMSKGAKYFLEEKFRPWYEEKGDSTGDDEEDKGTGEAGTPTQEVDKKKQEDKGTGKAGTPTQEVDPKAGKPESDEKTPGKNTQDLGGQALDHVIDEKWKKAEEATRAALRQNKKDTSALIAGALILEKNGRYHKAYKRLNYVVGILESEKEPADKLIKIAKASRTRTKLKRNAMSKNELMDRRNGVTREDLYDILKEFGIDKKSVYLTGKHKKDWVDLVYLAFRVDKAHRYYVRDAMVNARLLNASTPRGRADEAAVAGGYMELLFKGPFEYHKNSDVKKGRKNVEEILNKHIYIDMEGGLQFHVYKVLRPEVIKTKPLSKNEDKAKKVVDALNETLEELHKTTEHRGIDMQSLLAALEMDGAIDSWPNMFRIWLDKKSKKAVKATKPIKTTKVYIGDDVAFQDHAGVLFMDKMGITVSQEHKYKTKSGGFKNSLQKGMFLPSEFPLFDVIMPTHNKDAVKRTLLEKMNDIVELKKTTPVRKQGWSKSTLDGYIREVGKLHQFMMDMQKDKGLKRVLESMGVKDNKWDLKAFAAYYESHPTNLISFMERSLEAAHPTGFEATNVTPLRQLFLINFPDIDIVKKELTSLGNKNLAQKKSTKAPKPNLSPGIYDAAISMINIAIDAEKVNYEKTKKTAGNTLDYLHADAELKRHKAIMLMAGTTPARVNGEEIRFMEWDDVKEIMEGKTLSTTMDDASLLDLLSWATDSKTIKIKRGKYMSRIVGLFTDKIQEDLRRALIDYKDALAAYIHEMGGIGMVREKYEGISIHEDYGLPDRMFVKLSPVQAAKNQGLLMLERKTKSESKGIDLKDNVYISVTSADMNKIVNDRLGGAIIDKVEAENPGVIYNIDNIKADLPTNLPRHMFVQNGIANGINPTVLQNASGWNREMIKNYVGDFEARKSRDDANALRIQKGTVIQDLPGAIPFDESNINNSSVLNYLVKLVAIDKNKVLKTYGLTTTSSPWHIYRTKEGYGLYLATSEERYLAEDHRLVQATDADNYKTIISVLESLGAVERRNLKTYEGLPENAFTKESFEEVKEEFLVTLESIGIDRSMVDLNFIDELVVLEDTVDKKQALKDQGWSEEKINEAITENKPIFVVGKYEALAGGRHSITIGHGANAETVLEEIAHAFIQGGGQVKGVTDNMVLGIIAHEEIAAKELARRWAAAGPTSIKIDKKAKGNILKNAKGPVVRFAVDEFTSYSTARIIEAAKMVVAANKDSNNVRVTHTPIAEHLLRDALTKAAEEIGNQKKSGGVDVFELSKGVENLLKELGDVAINKEQENRIMDETKNMGQYNSFLSKTLSKSYIGRRWLEFWNPLSTTPGYEFVKGVRTAMGGVMYKADELTDKVVRIFTDIRAEFGDDMLSNVFDYMEGRGKFGNEAMRSARLIMDANVLFKANITKKFERRDMLLKEIRRHENDGEQEDVKAKKEQLEKVQKEILNEKFVGIDYKHIKTIGDLKKVFKLNDDESITIEHVTKIWQSIMKKAEKLQWLGDTAVLNDSFYKLPNKTKSLLQQAKRMQVKLADMLLERDLISEDTYWNYYGRYMHYMYLRNMVGADWNLTREDKHLQIETELGKLGLLEQKRILIEDYKKSLGQIKDPSLIIGHSMTETLHHIAKIDYVNSIKKVGAVIDFTKGPLGELNAFKKNGVWWIRLDDDQQKDFRTDTWGEAFLTKTNQYQKKGKAKSQHMLTTVEGEVPVTQLKIAEVLEERSSIKRSIEMAEKSNKGGQFDIPQMKKYLGKLDKLLAPINKWEKENGVEIGKEYVLAPDTWGDVGGEFISKPIYQDLLPALSSMEADIESGGIAGTALRAQGLSIFLFKMGKAALNVPTAFRNVISNLLQNNLRGRPLQLVIDDYRKAITGMVTKGGDWVTINGKRINLLEEFYRSGAGGKTQWSEELKGMLKEYAYNYKNKGNVAGSLYRLMEFLVKISRYYGHIDVIAKYSIYRQMRTTGTLNKLGYASGTPSTIREAADEALKWGMDYSLASRSIKGGRKFVVPFITYQYKAASLIYDTAVRRPWVLAKWSLLMWGGAGGWSLARELSQLLTGIDDDEFNRQVRNLAYFVKEKSTYMPLPVTDGKGNIMWFDGTYFMPWGTMYNMFSDMSQNQVAETFKGLGVGNPFLTIFTTLSTVRKGQPAVDPFTQTPIYNMTDSYPQKMNKIMAWIENLAVPGMFQNWHVPAADKKGAIPLSLDVLIGKVSGKERKSKWGQVKGYEQLLSNLGINPVISNRRQSVAMRKARIRKLKSEESKKFHSNYYKQNPEARRKVKRRTNKLIQEIRKEAWAGPY